MVHHKRNQPRTYSLRIISCQSGVVVVNHNNNLSTEGVRFGLSQKRLPRDSTLTYSPPPNLLSEVVRCGASQKKPTKDSTLTYSLGWFTFSDVPQIAAYHNKLQTLELNCEVTHQLSLPYDLHTASDLVTTIVNILKRCSDNVHVVVSV